MVSRKILIVAIATIAVVAGSVGAYVATLPKVTTINGAGATFPFPLLSSMTVEYNKIYPNLRFNYQSIGSGGGVRQHTAKTIDFGASDFPLSEAQRANATNTLHIPFTIGSVVLVYNLSNIQKGLKMNGTVIADIFLGAITRWNDTKIRELNPTLELPSDEILVVHRSDGSGTTFIWTSYLSLVSPAWSSRVGRGSQVEWPLGRGQSGNEGVASLVRSTQYATGYVELAYAITNNMSYAYVQNPVGNYVEPTLDSVRSAAESKAQTLPRGDESWAAIDLLNAPGPDAYPIASFSYILVYKELNVLSSMDQAKAKVLVDFVWWAVHDGQALASPLQYVPLPTNVVVLNEATLRSITFNGQALVS